jgi:hypothetical protein
VITALREGTDRASSANDTAAYTLDMLLCCKQGSAAAGHPVAAPLDSPGAEMLVRTVASSIHVVCILEAAHKIPLVEGADRGTNIDSLYAVNVGDSGSFAAAFVAVYSENIHPC